jgi:hypothetical protein
MDVLVVIGLGAISGLIAAEIIAYAPGVGRLLISRAADRLPEAQREQLREEWLAHLDELPGALGKLKHGVGCILFAARRIRREAAGLPVDSVWHRIFLHVLLLHPLLKAVARDYKKHPISFKQLRLSWEILKIYVDAHPLISVMVLEKLMDDFEPDQRKAEIEALREEGMYLSFVRYFLSESPHFKDLPPRRPKVTAGEAQRD